MKNFTRKDKKAEAQLAPLVCAITILVNNKQEISYSVTPNQIPVDLVIQVLDTTLNALIRQRREALAQMEMEKQNVNP